MQGVVFMPQNPQQGSPPPNSESGADMAKSPDPSRPTKDSLSNRSDSGIFSATANTTIEPSDSDNRSDCSSPERKYVCPICETMLTSQHDFTLHIRSHNNDGEKTQTNNEKGYSCRICRKVLSSSSSLDRHVLVHSGERPFHCKYCGDTFTTNGNMHRHMRTHSHKTENYESDASSDTNSTEFNNNKIESRHGKRKLEDVEFTANKKRHVTGSEDEEEEEEEARQSYKCPVCERSDFDTLTNLEAHLEDNHPEYPSKCNQCKQIFPNNKQLILHKQTSHDGAFSKHPVVGFKDLTFVDFSSEKFPHIARRECELNLHKVTGGLRFQCGRCARAFPCSNSLEIHETNCMDATKCLDLSKTNVSDDEIRRSEFFSRLNLQDNSPEKKIFQSPNKLREHLARAMDSTKDLADIQSILSNINLQQLQSKQNELRLSNKHETSIDASKADQEEESQDDFAIEFRKMKLRGEFPCRLCTAVFPNLRALKGHNRAHLNGNNNGTYFCNMCPHSSVDKAALIRHMRTHNGDRPYECSLCNYAFTTKANCERHLRNRHAKTTREEVKKAIIYHPSEDPTNEDLNKLNKDEVRTPEKIHCSTPKTLELKRIGEETKHLVRPVAPPVIPELKPSNLHKFSQEGVASLFQRRYDNSPQNLTNKIQVKPFEALKDTNRHHHHRFDYHSEEESFIEEEEEEPLDLVLDLSKKKCDEEKRQIEEETPTDLSKKHIESPVTSRFPTGININDVFAQKIDPTAALYATHLANLYRSGFHIPNWPGFPINPLLFPPTVPQTPQDLKERIQRFQMCGGSMVSEDFKKLQATKPPETYTKTQEPLTLNVESGFHDGMSKIHSPLQQTKPEMMQSPNSVKMVIKNGVLMPKQKQRRYRTERPFTCEHCSARFTLRSNMERHIKQQHPQFWSQRQRGNVGNPGRKPQMKQNYCDLVLPPSTYDLPKMHEYDEAKEKIKFAILAQQLRANQKPNFEVKREEDEDCALIIDEKKEIIEEEEEVEEDIDVVEAPKLEKTIKNEEDLVPVSKLLDNANQQQFKEYFKNEEAEGISEEDEEGLVASGSTSEGNISGTDENRSESETISTVPVKKKSAYSLAPNRVSCPYCSRKFPWTSSLRRHILTHTGQKPFKCSHCPLLFTTKSNCDRHLLRKHGNTATTISNDAANNNASNYLMRNVPERPFKCSNCPSSTFSTYSNLKKHISSKHSTNAQGDDIKAQGYEAGSSEDEKANIDAKNDWESQISYNKLPVVIPTNNDVQSSAVTNSELPFKCHLCEGSFGERQEALDHIRDKHPSEYDLLMSKNALDSSATTPDDASHHDEDDSDIRGKFPDYSNRKVICAWCMRRFWSAEDLRRHMRTHTGERPFSCDICRRRFTLKHSMLRHRKKHNVNFEHDANNSDDEGKEVGRQVVSSDKTDESDGNEGGGDLISNLLGIRDRSIIEKVLAASADDAAKLLGVKNGGGKE